MHKFVVKGCAKVGLSDTAVLREADMAGHFMTLPCSEW